MLSRTTCHKLTHGNSASTSRRTRVRRVIQGIKAVRYDENDEGVESDPDFVAHDEQKAEETFEADSADDEKGEDIDNDEEDEVEVEEKPNARDLAFLAPDDEEPETFGTDTESKSEAEDTDDE
jgi:hypothetical protein